MSVHGGIPTRIGVCSIVNDAHIFQVDIFVHVEATRLQRAIFSFSKNYPSVHDARICWFRCILFRGCDVWTKSVDFLYAFLSAHAQPLFVWEALKCVPLLRISLVVEYSKVLFHQNHARPGIAGTARQDLCHEHRRTTYSLREHSIAFSYERTSIDWRSSCRKLSECSGFVCSVRWTCKFCSKEAPSRQCGSSWISIQNSHGDQLSTRRWREQFTIYRSGHVAWLSLCVQPNAWPSTCRQNWHEFWIADNQYVCLCCSRFSTRLESSICYSFVLERRRQLWLAIMDTTWIRCSQSGRAANVISRSFGQLSDWTIAHGLSPRPGYDGTPSSKTTGKSNNAIAATFSNQSHATMAWSPNSDPLSESIGLSQSLHTKLSLSWLCIGPSQLRNETEQSKSQVSQKIFLYLIRSHGCSQSKGTCEVRLSELMNNWLLFYITPKKRTSVSARALVYTSPIWNLEAYEFRIGLGKIAM